MVSDSFTSLSFAAVTPLLASQPSSTRGTTEDTDVELEAKVEPDEEDVDVMRRLQEGRYQTPCNLNYSGGRLYNLC
ncbi:unnamed protein product [Taenia asiatica]|uniref:Secreted protein n=1 Tax=Taenia asiatica TaxID=60517 RepID=A0A0R3VY74_TAEAS|nr:unnamed protein product [Taenia asiatica]